MNQPHPEIYSIKRHGTTLESCDSEPVHTPGCVQPHGVLFALRPSDLTVLQVSESCAAHLGAAPRELLGRSAAAVLGDACAGRILELLEREPLERNPTFITSVTPPGVPRAFDVSIHTVDGVLLAELEPTLRWRGGPPPDHYDTIRRTVARIRVASTLRELFQIVLPEIRRLTGLSRVMAYRFHPDDSGEVFAEDRREDLPSWLGLRYPAHDIPRPAREIFKKIWIRPVPDARAELAEMVPLANPDTGKALEMTHCALRGASVMYTEYIKNMGVAASLTLSLRHGGELWGLIACHNDEPITFPHQVRAACELLAQFTSLLLGNAAEREAMEYRIRMESVHHALLARLAQDGDLSTMLRGQPTILDGLQAGGAAICRADEVWTSGSTPREAEIRELAGWVSGRLRRAGGGEVVYATDRLAAEHPPAASYTAVASGLLALPLSRGGRSMILWFRPEVEQTVSWGGNPHEAPAVVGPSGPRLTPRKSFEIWKETVRGRSVPWDPVEIQAAETLRHLVMDLVVTRAEQLAEINEALTRSNDELDSFAYIASHDLKEPLRGIHKHARILHDQIKTGAALDPRALERTETMLRLTVRMDGLLDVLLRFSRLGKLRLERVDTPLSQPLEEAIDMLGSLTVEKKVTFRIPRPLPTVPCERVRVREIFSNLISNAIKYTDSEDRWVEIGFVEPHEPRPAFLPAESAPAAAAGERIFYVRDGGIGIDRRYHEQVFRMFKRLHGRDEYGGGSGAGLAIVKKLVEQHEGVVWVASQPGEGSTFCFTLSRGGRA